MNGVAIFAALGVYLGTILGLRPLVLHKTNKCTPEAFNVPGLNGKSLVVLHQVISYLAFGGSLIGGPLLGSTLLNKPNDLGVAAWLTVSGWNLFNGLFELLTGVCPAYGILIKRQSSQYYQCGERVRWLGCARIVLSLLLVAGVWLWA